jgi:hypothetical protein
MKFLITMMLALAATFAVAGEDTKDKSVYVPPCFDMHAKPKTRNKNSVFVMTGPSGLDAPPGEMKENLFLTGYTRELREDLGLGVMIIFSNRRFIGVPIGLEYKF